MRTRQLDRHPTIRLLAALLLFGAMFLMAGCGALAPLAQLIQPPRFEQRTSPLKSGLIGGLVGLESLKGVIKVRM